MALSKEIQAQDDANLCKLKDDIDKELSKRRDDKFAEFSQSNEYKKLKAVRKSLAAKGDKLRKEMTVNVPIKFTVALMDYGSGDSLSNFLYNGIDLCVEGKLDKKQSNFNKEQARLLNDYITRFVENACWEVETLFPKEVRDEFKALGKEYKTFLDEVKKAGLNLEDLEY